MIWMEIGFWPHENRKYKLWASQILCSSSQIPCSSWLRISHFFQRFPSKRKHFWSKDYSSPLKETQCLNKYPLQTFFFHLQTSPSRGSDPSSCEIRWFGIVGRNPADQLLCSLSHYLQNLYIPRWCRIWQSSCRIWDRNLEPATFTLKKIMVNIWTF